MHQTSVSVRYHLYGAVIVSTVKPLSAASNQDMANDRLTIRMSTKKRNILRSDVRILSRGKLIRRRWGWLRCFTTVVSSFMLNPLFFSSQGT